MTNKVFSLLLFLSFIALASSPALAGYTIEIETPLAIDMPNSVYGIDCTNSTGTLYCYVIDQCNGGGKYCIDRFNATWQDRYECEIGVINIPSNGFSLINATHAQGTRVLNVLSYIIPISEIETNTSCVYSSSYSLNGATVGAGHTNPGYFNPTNASSSLIYRPEGIYNSSNGTFIYNYSDIFPAFNDFSMTSVRFPNESDNTTGYGIDAQTSNYLTFNTSNVFKIEDGLHVEQYDNPFLVYDIQVEIGLGYYVYDFIEDGETTWLFMVYNQTAYKMNWTEYEGTDAVSLITAVSPKNNASIIDNPPTFNVYITPSTNGTITWYIDGVYRGSTFINASAITQSVYFSPPGTLTLGFHSWYANFTDFNENSWITATEWFNEGTASIGSDPVQGLAAFLGDFFSISDQETSNNMFSILCSLIVSIFLVVIITIYSGKSQPSGNALIMVFVVGFMAMLIFFTIAEMLNTFYTVLFIVVAALGMWALFGGKIGGG